MIPLTLTQADEGQRLDAVLSALYPMVSRATIKRLLDQGCVIRNDGKKCTKGDKINLTYSYQLLKEPSEEKLQPNPNLQLTILFEDDAILALKKPAGLNCQPNKASETDTIANALLARWPTLEGVGDTPLTCGILHRIDFDTSGLVLVAKTQEVYTALREQFSLRQVEKHYQALVTGSLFTPQRLEHSLAHNPRYPGRMIDAEKWHDAKRPMRAVTAYQPILHARLNQHPVSLLDVTIFTGVTHQIRAQLSFHGHPIVGDKTYGGFLVQDFNRHFLHATAVTFKHPLTDQQVTIEAPLTKDLLRLLNLAQSKSSLS